MPSFLFVQRPRHGFRTLPRRIQSRLVLTATALTVFALLAGCGLQTPDNVSGQGPLSVPNSGTARLLSRAIGDQTPDSLHWKWSIIGGHNWQTATGQNTRLALTGSYPLNDATQVHGTNVWECDLTAVRTPDAPKIVHWKATLHGSNGSTAHTSGTLPLAATLDSTIKIVTDGDITAGLPSETVLARVGSDDLRLTLER